MYRLILWPVLAPSFLFAIGIGAVAPVLVIAALQVGASEALASAVVAFAGAVSLAVTVPVGVFIDRVGDRRAMVVATATAAAMLGVTVMVLAFPTPASLALFVTSIVLRTPAMVAWSLARQAAVAEAVPASQRGKAMTALGGTMRAGNLVGPLVGAALLMVFPLWSVFTFCAFTALLATGLLFVRRLNASFDEQVASATAAADRAAEPGDTDWRAVWFAGAAISILAVSRVALSIVVALWGVYLGWSEAQISLIVAVGSAIELVFMVPGGYLKDRLGRTPVLVVCLISFGAGYLIMPLWPQSLGCVLAVVVIGVGNGLGAGINMTIGADLSPDIGRAKFLSVWAMFTQAGMLGGPLAISALLTLLGLPAAIACVGGLALAGAGWSASTASITKLPGMRRRPPLCRSQREDE